MSTAHLRYPRRRLSNAAISARKRGWETGESGVLTSVEEEARSALADEVLGIVSDVLACCRRVVSDVLACVRRAGAVQTRE